MLSGLLNIREQVFSFHNNETNKNNIVKKYHHSIYHIYANNHNLYVKLI